MLRVNNFSRFNSRLINLSQGNSLVLGELLTAQTQIGAEVEVTKLLRVTHEAVITTGAHLLWDQEHFLAERHRVRNSAVEFRLVPLPEEVEWSYDTGGTTDLVTGLQRPGTRITRQIWVRREHAGLSPQVRNKEGLKFQYRTYASIRDGDTLDGQVVQHTWRQQGILYAVT